MMFNMLFYSLYDVYHAVLIYEVWHAVLLSVWCLKCSVALCMMYIVQCCSMFCLYSKELPLCDILWSAVLFMSYLVCSVPSCVMSSLQSWSLWAVLCAVFLPMWCWVACIVATSLVSSEQCYSLQGYYLNPAEDRVWHSTFARGGP